MLHIFLFGSPKILLDQQPIPGLRRKNRALLCYLAAQRDPQSRDHLLTLFWPDNERASAQQILRTMLHDLRKHLGVSLLTEGDTLALENIEVDVRDFQAHLLRPTTDIKSLRDTLTLYRDDFLKDFTLPDSPDFEDWAAAERERYRALAVRGWVALSRLYEAGRDYSATLDSLEQALRFDPLQEEIQRACMRVQYLSGDRPGAVLRYDRLYKLLDAELGVTPMAETRTLYDAILADTSLAAELHSAMTSIIPAIDAALLPFVGRSAELQILEMNVSPGKLLAIEGEPGIGKTRLAEVFLDSYSRHQPMLVLRGNAYELEQSLPYQPVIDALRGLLSMPEWGLLKSEVSLSPSWLAEITRLVPELAAEFPILSPPAVTASEARLWESLKQFLLALARQHPVFLFLDDLQWADISTLGFLGYLVRRSGSMPLLLLTTIRPMFAHPQQTTLFQTLQHEHRLVRVSLTALTRDDVSELAQHFSPADSLTLAAWLVEHTEGNPYFVTELLRFAYESKLLAQNGALNLDLLNWTPVLPPTIQNLIESRLLRLSENARPILELAAVVGYQFSYRLIAQAAQVSEGDLLDAIDDLRNAGLIQPHEDEQFSFDHSLTMEVAYQAMGTARSRAIHRRVAEALEALHRSDLDAAAGVIASHFARSNTSGRAVPYAFRAGQRAARLAAWSEAIAFYGQALDGTADDTQRRDILIARGEARFHLGDFATATEDFQTALQFARASGDLAALENACVFLHQALIPQARFAEAIALAEALRQTGPPELALCAEFIWGAGLAVQSAQATEAERHLREAERLLGQPRPFTSRITRALLNYQLGSVMSQQGRHLEAVAFAKEALRLSEQDETALDLLRQVMVYNHIAYNLLLLNDFSAADYARAGVKAAQEKGVFSHLPYLLSTSGESALAQNDFDSAEQFFLQGLALAEEIHLAERIAGLTANLGLLAQARSQPDLAREYLRRALAHPGAASNKHLSVRIRLWLAVLLTGDEARDLLGEARLIAESAGFTRLLEQIEQLEQQLR
jgi:DNA-binding SARP family transcriptional activator